MVAGRRGCCRCARLVSAMRCPFFFQAEDGIRDIGVTGVQTCALPIWLNSPTSYTYTWQRDGSSIAAATSSNYTLTASDVGKAVTCTVVAHNAVGDSAPAISRSEERRVGKEWRSGWSPTDWKTK